MPDPIDIQTLLAQLEAERAELDVTITQLRRRLGLSPSNGDSPRPLVPSDPNAGRDTAVVVGRVRPDEFFRLSISDAIMKYIGIMKQPQNPMAIVNGLKAGGVLTNAKNFYANVNTELKRMKARDLIVNTPSGWGLSEWYPNKPKAVEAKPKKRPKKRPKKMATGTPTTAAPVASESKGWRGFLATALKEGKSMKEASAAWKALNASGGGQK